MGHVVTDEHADIFDPEVYTHGVPLAAYRHLRDHDPVSWWDGRNGQRGCWAVVRYDDVLTVSRQVDRFSAAQGIRIEDMALDEMEARRTMIEMDPPEHTRLRRMVSKPFTRREVMAYENAIRQLARAVVDDALQHADIDFVQAVARQLPMRMLGRLLGISDEEGDWLVSRGDALIGNEDPELTAYPVGLSDTDPYRLMPFRSPVALELFDFAEDVARRRRSHPADDIISAILAPTIDGEPLSEIEFKNFFTLLVSAGNDTTRYTMAAGMQALMEHPDQLAQLRDDLSMMETAVEEILRYSTVTMHFRRTAVHDVELGGRSIAAGDKVIMWYASADRDERQFVEPDRFDITRSPNDHVAFGRQSPHLCLGAALARLELKVLFEELLPRLADIRPAGPIARLRSNFISGIKRLPVTVAVA